MLQTGTKHTGIEIWTQICIYSNREPAQEVYLISTPRYD